MSLYDEYTEEYLYFIFTNALVLKAMYDKGYSVKNIRPDDPILASCLERIFRGVEWIDIDSGFDEKVAQSFDENDEEKAIYEDFHYRDHYKIKIPIKEVGELWPFTEDELKRIEEKMNTFVWDPEQFYEDCYLPLWAFYKWEWLESEEGLPAGISLYMYNVPEYSEELPITTEIIDILELLDVLRDIKARRNNS